MSHTPGPWKQSGRTVYSQVNGSVCMMTEIHNETRTISTDPVSIASPDWREAMDNARLIAAAPDLLEACEDIANLHDSLEAARFAFDVDSSPYDATLTSFTRQELSEAEQVINEYPEKYASAIAKLHAAIAKAKGE